GLAVGDRVAIMAKNGPDWVYFDQAAHALGLVVVPLFVDDRPDNVAYCLNDSNVRVVLVEGPEQVAKLQEVADRIPQVQRIVSAKELQGWLPETAEVRPPVKVDGNKLATIVYTSGTTGKPKGVMLSHQNMLQNAVSGLEVYDVFPEDVFLSFLPLSHMLERTVGYYLTMIASSIRAFARSIQQLGEDFRTQQPTIIVSMPRVFEKLHGQLTATLESASPTRRKLFQHAHEVGWDLFLWQQKRGAWKPSLLLWPVFKALVARKLLERMGGRLRLCISGGAAL